MINAKYTILLSNNAVVKRFKYYTISKILDTFASAFYQDKQDRLRRQDKNRIKKDKEILFLFIFLYPVFILPPKAILLILIKCVSQYVDYLSKLRFSKPRYFLGISEASLGDFLVTML